MYKFVNNLIIHLFPIKSISMKFNHLKAIPITILAMAATACVDDAYDLNDIDTTTRLSVNDLVIPINLDNIELSSVIDIDETDPNADIQIVNGEYAYVNHGDFTSGGISIPTVLIKSAQIPSIVLSLTPPYNVGSLSGIALPDLDFTLPTEIKGYSFNADNITEDICGLTQVVGDFDVNVELNITGFDGMAAGYSLSGLQLQLPEGITFTSTDGATIDNAKGILTLNRELTSPRLTLSLRASGLKIPAGAFDEATHSISIIGEVGLIGGQLKVKSNNKPVTLPENLGLTLDFNIGDITVKSIDGTIKYSIGNVSVPDIDISNLPDVLAQPGTNLMLYNPCLYLSVNNPVWESGVHAVTGFEINAYHGENASTYTLDDGYFTIAAKAVNNYCFSPSDPFRGDAEFSNYTHVPFSQLSYVLSGDGLPDKLKVELTDPNLPRQDIKDFKVGYDYGEIKGNYKFVAPLAFKNGSFIKYTDKLDGWSSEDLDAVTIEKLEVNFDISTDIPIAIEFSGYPIDKNGNRMTNVTISPVTIDANANDQSIRLTVTGSIKNLDGMEFEAKANAQEGKALSPDMSIVLKNVRPRVSGYFEKEL